MPLTYKKQSEDFKKTTFNCIIHKSENFFFNEEVRSTPGIRARRIEITYPVYTLNKEKKSMLAITEMWIESLKFSLHLPSPTPIPQQ